MYGALWRRLPGPAVVRAVLCLALFLGLVLVLFTLVFPKLEHHVPFTHDTVSTTSALGALRS